MLDTTKIGDSIHAHRKRAGLTQRKLGELARIGISNISSYENGKIPCLYNAIAIADALRVSLDDLIGRVVMDCPTLTPPNEPLTLDKKRAIAESCLHYSKSGCCLLRGYAPLDCPRCKEWQSNEANVALTLEQLREMNGEPVYIIASDMGIAEWNVIAGKEWITVAYDVPRNGFKAVVEGVGFINGRAFRIDSYGTDWFAYRRPAEGEEDNNGT